MVINQRLLDGGGGGGLTKLGAGTLTLGARSTYTGLTTVAGGTLAFGASQRLSRLEVGAGATTAIAPGRAATLVMDSLSIAGGPRAWSGTLELAGGAAAVDYDGPSSPLLTIADQVRSGRQGAGGITSSIANSTSVGVGYAESAFALGPDGGLFGGEAVDATAVLLRPTLYGDADLDGVVGADDFFTLRRNLGATGSRAVWQNGDFNYDGRVGASDLVLLRRNYGTSMPVTAAAAQFIAVPEPGATGVMLLSLAALALRRPPRDATRHCSPVRHAQFPPLAVLPSDVLVGLGRVGRPQLLGVPLQRLTHAVRHCPQEHRLRQRAAIVEVAQGL